MEGLSYHPHVALGYGNVVGRAAEVSCDEPGQSVLLRPPTHHQARQPQRLARTGKQHHMHISGQRISCSTLGGVLATLTNSVQISDA